MDFIIYRKLIDRYDYSLQVAGFGSKLFSFQRRRLFLVKRRKCQ
jgi:hypothetical protein